MTALAQLYVLYSDRARSFNPWQRVLYPNLNIIMNGLVYYAKQSRLLAYIDKTAIFYDNGMPEKIEYVINADLANVDKWYEANGMRRNTQNTN